MRDILENQVTSCAKKRFPEPNSMQIIGLVFINGHL